MDLERRSHPDIEPRGRMFYLRKRVPVRYASVEHRGEINVTLGTRDFDEAVEKVQTEWATLVDAWEATLTGQAAPGSRQAYDEAMAILDELGLPWCRADDLAAGSIDELIERVEAAARLPRCSTAVAAILGGLDLPAVMVADMPVEFERIRTDFVKAKNQRQHREWRNKYRRAAAAFVVAVRNEPMTAIRAYDAELYRRYWWERCGEDDITADYAEKHLRYMEQMVDAYHEDLRVLPKDYVNHFTGLSLGEVPGETWRIEKAKLALPSSWIMGTLLDFSKMAGLDAEAHAIAILCAELGARESEIFDLPPKAFRLDHPIPHIVLDIVAEGEDRRELKNTASRRKLPLLGHSLAAARRFPTGFPSYRGNARYYARINDYLRDRGLFPRHEDEPGRTYTIGGLRHGFEDRAIGAGLDNELRGFLMGHSIGLIRGRPVYGTELELPLRSLLLEMVAFPTDGWTPRPQGELRAMVDRLLAERGVERHWA